MTGSVGLLSDAAESVVNLVAAVVALIALRVAARPADDNHHYGHGKAEYFSAGIEGLMIFVAAAVILVSAMDRFLHPSAIESVGIGLAISTVASVVNGAVGMLLIRAGRAHRSVTLTADGKHLIDRRVDLGRGHRRGVPRGPHRLAAARPGRRRVVGVNILITGYRLVSQSVTSLLDAALPEEDLTAPHRGPGPAAHPGRRLRPPAHAGVRPAPVRVADAARAGQLDGRAGARRGRRGRGGDRRGPHRDRRGDPHRAAGTPPPGTAGDQLAQERPAGPPYR